MICFCPGALVVYGALVALLAHPTAQHPAPRLAKRGIPLAIDQGPGVNFYSRDEKILQDWLDKLKIEDPETIKLQMPAMTLDRYVEEHKLHVQHKLLPVEDYEKFPEWIFHAG
ncbi:hypothetical protein PtB15_16B147 [Puccinia triticina]|nr:hypothetical protein PtB15_16B147 [Puccinia triticina]